MVHQLSRTTTRVAAVTVSAGLIAGTLAPAAIAATGDPASAEPGAAAAGVQRGRLVKAEFLRGMTVEQARAWLAKDGFSAKAVRHGVDLYRLTYRTVDVRQRPTTATGLLVLPRGKARSLRAVSYTHGTTSYKPDAPSRATDVWGQAPAVMYGSAGFAAVAPDYLGLGFGPGAHPWKHVPSETTASLDMLRAARQFAPRKGRTLQRQVLVAGFSQGASSALGLARTLQRGGDKWFRVRAVAPIAGGYDFRGAQLPAMLKGDQLPPKLTVAYTTYLLTSWNRIYGLYKSPYEVFHKDYAGVVERLFDGTTPGQEMLKVLPDSPDRLLTERGRALLRNPAGPFDKALRVDGSVCRDWTPKVPVRLYKISKDEQAVTANTDHCQASFRARGLRVPAVDVGEQTYEGSRHLGANLAGTELTVAWFSRLR